MHTLLHSGRGTGPRSFLCPGRLAFNINQYPKLDQEEIAISTNNIGMLLTTQNRRTRVLSSLNM
jgi:hypothetical protein